MYCNIPYYLEFWRNNLKLALNALVLWHMLFKKFFLMISIIVGNKKSNLKSTNLYNQYAEF